jgi:hypothetical protein
MKPVKILYIAGWGRSGSTILGNVLGSVPGFHHVGETFFARRNALRGEFCGCGVLLTACEFWRELGREVAGDGTSLPPAEMFRVAAAGRMRHLLLAGTPRGRKYLGTRFRDAIECVDRTFRAMRSRFDVRVIVDSSKVPTYARVLALAPSADVYVLHLVRDPRASAFSYRRRRLRTNGTPMARHDVITQSLRWMLFNLVTEQLWGASSARYVRVRYEDVMARPVASMGRVMTWLGEEEASLPFAGPRAVLIRPSHSVGGNPSRMRSGRVELRRDDEWMDRLGRARRWLVTGVCWPLMRRYGYGAGGEAGSARWATP